MFDESENEKKKAVNKYEIFERKTFNGKLFVGNGFIIPHKKDFIIFIFISFFNRIFVEDLFD
jgi:hypothetical protein